MATLLSLAFLLAILAFLGWVIYSCFKRTVRNAKEAIGRYQGDGKNYNSRLVENIQVPMLPDDIIGVFLRNLMATREFQVQENTGRQVLLTNNVPPPHGFTDKQLPEVVRMSLSREGNNTSLIIDAFVRPNEGQILIKRAFDELQSRFEAAPVEQ